MVNQRISSNIEQQEITAYNELMSTYKPNSEDEGMEADGRNAFARTPNAQILVAPPEAEPRAHLALTFKATLLQMPDCNLYTGNDESALTFEQATGLSPIKFCQAWLEVDGSPWTCCHPTVNEDGHKQPERVAEAMCKCWGLSVRKWSLRGRKEADRLKKVDSWDYATKLIRCGLSRVMSIDGKDRARTNLLRQISIIANLRCAVHTTRRKCDCPDALSMTVRDEIELKRALITLWEADIADSDAALLYTGPDARVAFQQASGQPPIVFANNLLTNLPKLEHFAVPGKTQFYGAFLTWWADTVSLWRSKTYTKTEIRTKLIENQPKIPRFTSDGAIIMEPNPHRNESGDPLCRYVHHEGLKGEGHVHTLVVYAKNKDGRGLVYDILRWEPCHSECRSDEPTDAEMRELLKELLEPFEREDEARAMAVVKEW